MAPAGDDEYDNKMTPAADDHDTGSRGRYAINDSGSGPEVRLVYASSSGPEVQLVYTLALAEVVQKKKQKRILSCKEGSTRSGIVRAHQTVMQLILFSLEFQPMCRLSSHDRLPEMVLMRIPGHRPHLLVRYTMGGQAATHNIKETDNGSGNTTATAARSVASDRRTM